MINLIYLNLKIIWVGKGKDEKAFLVKNGKKEYRSIPAANVKGSPIKGTHDNNSDHFPYLLKIILLPLYLFLSNRTMRAVTYILWKVVR